MFQEDLQLKDAINILSYNTQNTIIISGKVPALFTWHIFQIIVDCLYFVLNACVLNQFYSYWLLYDAL
jgi:hypothetical protein